MASLNAYEVHLGFWTNWSNGKIQGATVTLSRQHGGFLIAFLAIFVGMVGKSFWRLGCFALHRTLSSDGQQDGLYHQRQAILRNSDTAQDGAWRLLMSMIAWRSGCRASRPIRRLLPIIVFAFVVSAAFGIASIFSSNVTSEKANQVLLTGKRCGSLDTSSLENVYERLTHLVPYSAENANRFLNYGMNCYTNYSNTDGCNLYIRPRLSLNSTRGMPCPFGDNICKLANDNLRMDTGYIDSHEHLGLNSAPKNRFQLRMVHECAPLKTREYAEDYNDPQYGPVKRYMYGANTNVRQTIGWTYEIATNNTYLPGDNTSSANIPRLDYQLGTEFHYATPNESLLIRGTNTWSPIPALHRTDADVHMLFLSAPEIRFSTPVDDPWFSAHKNESELHYQKTGDKFAAFLQDEPLGAMACALQIQYCNPNLPEKERCEPLRGWLDPRKSERVKKIFKEPSQFDTIKWAESTWVPSTFSPSILVGYIGATALRARYGLSYGYQSPLPDSQWQIEAEHLTKASLASLQDTFVTVANGVPLALDKLRKVPAKNDTVANYMCRNQKIISTGYSSFNVLGISLILIIGTLIIILDIGLEPTVAWWQRRTYNHKTSSRKFYHDEKGRHLLYGALEWSQTSMLQLQRMAHEEAGYGTWTSCNGDTPVTEADELLASLNLRNVKHPALKKKAKYILGSRWNESTPSQPFGVRRADTGVETLVDDEVALKKVTTIESMYQGEEWPIRQQQAGNMRGLRVQIGPPMSDIEARVGSESRWRDFR